MEKEKHEDLTWPRNEVLSQLQFRRAVYQQVAGKTLTMNRILAHLPHGFADRILQRALTGSAQVNPDDMYLYKTMIEMIWPYDDQGRLVGEDVWEPEPAKAELIKLDASEVLTSAQAKALLSPLIKPLPAVSPAVLATGASASQ